MMMTMVRCRRHPSSFPKGLLLRRTKGKRLAQWPFGNKQEPDKDTHCAMRRSSGRLWSQGAQMRLGGAVVSAPRQATTSAHAGLRRLATTAASGPAQPLVPPFTEQTARAKVQAAENLWNTKDPSKVPPPSTMFYIIILLLFI
jgi:hypothetical protein